MTMENLSDTIPIEKVKLKETETYLLGKNEDQNIESNEESDQDIEETEEEDEENFPTGTNNNNKSKGAKGDGEGKYEVKINPIKQCSTWDCGLACVKMVLEAYQANYLNLETICSALELNTSIWTIDLCYILKHYNISHIFYTCTIGVDKNYAKEPFYKEYYDEDVDRVERLFNQARSVGLKYEKKTVGMGEIIRHLKTLRPIIILVNWSLIKSQQSSLSACFGTLFRSYGNYQGHFIVLTGLTTDEKKIFYLNPEKSTRRTVSTQCLDNARKSFGTDQDIIFITEKLHKAFPKISPGSGDK